LDYCVSEFAERSLRAIYEQLLNICGFSTIENMREKYPNRRRFINKKPAR
jgi:hypothetical protein